MSEHAMTTSVIGALEAVGIPVERRGRSRTARLQAGERAVYRWILHRFADGERPDSAALAQESARYGFSLEAVLAILAGEDLVHVDERGSIVVAYPFSGRPTPHRVRFDGREVYAMCAIDALGMAPMLRRPIDVISSDPVDAHRIRLSLTPEGRGSWTPQEAVVVVGRACEGAAFRGCCNVLNFFASSENAGQYLREHPDVRGFPIFIPEAIELGRVIFGDVLVEE